MKKSSTSYKTGKKFIVAVIGGHKCGKQVEELATKLGKLLAKVEVIVVCGGLGGVMEAVAKGVSVVGGVTVGLLPGDKKEEANPYIDIPIATGLGYVRNTLVAGCADLVIALPGEYGTLSEIAYALNMKKPVVGIGSWDIQGVRQVRAPQDAIKVVKAMKDGRL